MRASDSQQSHNYDGHLVGVALVSGTLVAALILAPTFRR